MAESFGDGAAALLLLSQKKSKLEGEPGEGEDPLKGLVSTSADPDLDISASGSKSAQASNPDLFSSIDFEEVQGDPFTRPLSAAFCDYLRQGPFPGPLLAVLYNYLRQKADLRHAGFLQELGLHPARAKIGDYLQNETICGYFRQFGFFCYLLEEQRKFEEKHGEGEDPLKPSTSADPDLKISTSSSKSTQASKLEGEPMGGEDPLKGLVKPWTSNYEPFSFIDIFEDIIEERSKKRDHDDYDNDGGRATTAKSSRLQKKPKLGEPEGEDVQGWVKTKAPAFSIDHILDVEMAKRGEPKGEDLQGLVKTRALRRKKSRALPRLQKKLKLGEDVLDQNLDMEIAKHVGGLVKTKALRRVKAKGLLRLLKKLKLGEPEGEELQGKKDPSIPNDPDMEDFKFGPSVVSTQASNTISGELLPLKSKEEEDYTDADTDEDTEGWWQRMSEERVSVWFYPSRPPELDYEPPKYPGWGYSDVDKNDPLWHDKFVGEIRRDTPRKYRVAALDPPGVEKKDEALWERYRKQIKESDGYDITDFPGITIMTPITPLIGFKQSPSDAERCRRFTDAAITEFNSTREENDQYEVHDILTVNVSLRGALSMLHYITFEAKKKNKNSNASAAAKEEDGHGGATLLTTFQARVLQKVVHTKGKVEDEVKVEECRIKALKPSPA